MCIEKERDAYCANICSLHTMTQMLQSKCRALVDLKYNATYISKGPTQHANHREEGWTEDAGRGHGAHRLFIPPPTPPQTPRQALPIMSCQIWPWASPLSLRIFTHTVTSDHVRAQSKNNTTSASQWCTAALASSRDRFVTSNYWGCTVLWFQMKSLWFSAY